MIRTDNEDGSTAYELTGLDIMNIFAAHMERGTGKAFCGGKYTATVAPLGEAPKAGVRIVVTPLKDASQ